MEADLSRFHSGTRFSDYLTGRREHGAPVLSFRRLAVLMSYLPNDSACAAVEFGPINIRTVDQRLAADLYQVMAGQKHHLAWTEQDRAERVAAVEKARADEAKKKNQLSAAAARAAKRRADIAAGVIE